MQEFRVSEGGCVVRLEQKIVVLVTDVVRNYTSPAQIVFDPCAGLVSNVKRNMVISTHSRFVVCELDTQCFKYAALSL